MESRQEKKTRKKAKRKGRKIHTPVTQARIRMRKDRALISRLHVLNKEIVNLKKQKDVPRSVQSTKLEVLQQEVEKLGGLDLYQAASKLGEKKHGNYNSAKWVVQQLQKHSVKTQEGKLQLLDVGALDTNYDRHHSWIDATAIDLNPQKPAIIKADFLTYKAPAKGLFDVVVLSLVINFAGDPANRGKMLQKACELCRPQGIIFIILPLACVTNSRYLTSELLDEMLVSLGCEQLVSHESRKLSHKMFKKTSEIQKSRAFPKKLLENGPGRNNFCIVVEAV